MIEQLDSGETDLAIILTESFFKRFEKNQDICILGLYVKSPLVWGIHTSPQTSLKTPSEIKQPNFLISRRGSGSELMSRVLGDRENWSSENYSFEIVNNLDGAVNAFQSGSEGLFLWEKFTTKPEVEKGNLDRIGEVPSPWPCFVIACKRTYAEQHKIVLKDLIEQLFKEIRVIESEKETPERIAEMFSLDLEDVESWMKQTEWNSSYEIERKVIQKAIEDMRKFEIITELGNWREAFHPDFSRLT